MIYVAVLVMAAPSRAAEPVLGTTARIVTKGRAMPTVRVISALGCQPCERVKLRLAELQARHAELTIEDVDMLTDEGVAIAARHRVWTLPTLIIDDTIVAEGDVELTDLETALGLMLTGG